MAMMVSFNDFSEEIMFKCFQNLEGGNEALPLRVVCKVWDEQLNPCNDTMWNAFGAQEFGDTNLQAPPAPKNVTAASMGFTGVDRYASLARAASLKQALWGNVETSGFGSREGTPWIFFGRTGEEVFAYGGYGPRGPANDLVVAPLTPLKKLLSVTSAGISASTEAGEGAAAADSKGKCDEASAEKDAPRLDFMRMKTHGRPPLESYGATVTPLVDDELPGCEWLGLDLVRSCIHDSSVAALIPNSLLEPEIAAQTTLFLVTGGYQYGGYRGESPDWAVGIVPPPMNGESSFQPRERAESPSRPPSQGSSSRDIIWVRPGPTFLDSDGQIRNLPEARSNASAVFVPARFADAARYPKGYIMLFGGNVDRRASNSIDILDLSNFTWSHLGELPGAPIARNSHSAILMPDTYEPASKAKILIFGGANGGDVPRSGEDFNDYAMFDPREMDWFEACGRSNSVPGRAHVAVKIGRSVLFFGGGRNPTNLLSAVDCQPLSEHNAKLMGIAEGENEITGMKQLLRSLKWSNLSSCNDAKPPPRAFHAAISLAPAGVPVLLIYGGWHPRYGNYGDIWAAKLDAWGTAEEGGGGDVGKRARAADSRFLETLHATAGDGPADGSDEEDDEDDLDEPWVNVGGRTIPLRIFARMLRQQMGDEMGNQMLMQMMAQRETGGDDDAEQEENDSDEEEDEDEETNEMSLADEFAGDLADDAE